MIDHTTGGAPFAETLAALRHAAEAARAAGDDKGAITAYAEALALAQAQAQQHEQTLRAKRQLEQQLAECTAALEQRNAELAIINSVQQGLAQQLDMQAMYDLVGDQIRDIFDAQVVGINIYDRQTDLVSFPYLIERGERFDLEPAPLGTAGFTPHMIRTRQPLMFNTDLVQRATEFGSFVLGDSQASKSYLGVPLVVGDEARGVIALENIDREHAFSENDLRLLSTLASSLSVALENVRLFAETRHLLAETEQRNAELALVNEIGQALAQQLDFQAIIELVGERVRALLDARSIYIALYDRQTNLIRFPYEISDGERLQGERLQTEPFELGEGLTSMVIRSRRAILGGTDSELLALGAIDIGGIPTESWLGVPIIAGDIVIGVIALESVQQHAFSDADARLLSTLAASMGVALENARLFAETRRLLAETEQRNAELATVNRIGQALASELELGALINLIGDQIRQTFAADIVYVALHDRQTDMLDFVYGYGQQLASLRFGEGLTGRIIQTRQPLLINEGMIERHTKLQVTPVGASSKSYLGVPIVVGEEAIGVISVQSTQQEGRFGEADVHLLTTVAANVGVAIQNARLYQETQRSAREMAALAEVGQDIATASDLDAVLVRIAARAKDLLHVRDIALYLWQPDEQAFRAKVALGYYVDEIKSKPVTSGEGITGRIARSGVAEIVNYPERDQRTAVIPGTPDMEEELEALMCAPLRLRDQIIGLITVWRARSNGLFEQADLAFLISLARQAAIAIENSRLYLETQRRANQMAALAEVGRDISATLDLPMVLERIACHAQELLASETSAVYLPEPSGRTFRAIAVLGADTEAILNDTITLGEGIIGDLARRGIAEVINDVTRDPRARLVPGTPQQEAEQLMVAPLLAGNRVSGMMAVWRSGRRAPFTEDDLDFLVGLARQAAIAIENARLFEEAQQARAQAETANVAKSTFLANMSHELRTPLNAVLGFAQVMERDQALSPRQREHLGIITNSGEYLLNLINGVLEMSKIEAGRVALNEATFDLHDLFRSVEELFQLRAEARHLSLLFDIAPEVPRYVRGDESKLRQVLINLLGNAVKFTHEGGISLHAAWRERPATSDQRPTDSLPDPFVISRSSLLVEVADSGEGIAQDQLPDLFEAFVQTPSGAKVQGGTGLGLAISRQFVRLMGGDITVNSRVGAGSTFCFDVQLAAADRSEVQDQRAERRVVGIDPNDRQEYRMLVVDDKLENRRLLVEWLRMTGFQVREAGNGAEALKVWEEWAPQMIWMDLRMPVLDGYEATKRIKASLQGQATVVVALTASAFEHEETMVLSAGCDDFVRKPVRESVIFEKIAQHLGVRFVYEERQPPTTAQDGAARLTPAQLAVLPADWVANLRQAILAADMDQIQTLIDQIREQDRALANELQRLADNFQIDQLQLLVQ